MDMDITEAVTTIITADSIITITTAMAITNATVATLLQAVAVGCSFRHCQHA